MAKNDNMIAALLRERAVYEARGIDDRVRQVDEQLEYHGYTPQADEDDGPQGRTATDGKQQTAAAPDQAAAADGQDKRGRGRPKLPRDGAGNIVRE